MSCSLEEWKAGNLFRILGCFPGVKRLSFLTLSLGNEYLYFHLAHLVIILLSKYIFFHRLQVFRYINVPERLPEKFKSLMVLELREYVLEV